jgi:DNA polymerase-3 subunit delta'
MTNWQTLIGHAQIRQWFSVAIGKGRLGGSFLFVGNTGIGKRTVATLLARTLLCESNPPDQMNPCGTCQACVQVAAASHPDLIRLSKPADKSFIPLELLIGPPDSRMQEGFCRDVRLRPHRGQRKVAIIEDADYLNEEGANCLLKTLEEPPPCAMIILIGTSEQRQLPTIRSRCQTIRFLSPTGDDAQRLLREVHGVDASEEQIFDALETAGGDVHVAAELLAGGADRLRQAIDAQLNATHPDPLALKRIITGHVDQAGKEPSKKRDAMRDVFAMAVQHYRRRLRHDAAGQVVAPVTLARLDRSLRALREVDRSANQATLIECYAADIAAGTTGDRGDIGS